jgi:hypothetical protein
MERSSIFARWNHEFPDLPEVKNQKRPAFTSEVMNGIIHLDVHKDTISIAVMNSAGKLIMESIIETKAITILQFFQGLQGDVYVTFEEGTWAAGLYDLLKPHVTQVVVCNPRKNALLKQGSKSDQILVLVIGESPFSNILP